MNALLSLLLMLGFWGTSSQSGSSTSSGSNTLDGTTPDENDDTPAAPEQDDEPEQPAEEPVAEDDEPEQPAEEPVAEDDEPEQPAEEPVAEDDEPEQPAEEPVAEDDEPEQPAEEPVAEDDEPEQPAEEPVAEDDEPEQPAEEPDQPVVAATVPVYLVDTLTDEIIMPLTNGATLSSDFVNNPNLAVVYIPEAGTEAGSITFTYGDIVRTESNPPYALFGDAEGGDIQGSTMFASGGDFSLTLEVFDGAGGTGNTIAFEEMSFNVETPTTTLPGTVPDPVDEEPVQEEPEEPVAEDPVQEDPVDEEPDEPVASPPDVADPDPLPPENDNGENDNSGDVVVADSSVDVLGGRVTTLSPEGDDIVSVRILNDVDHGSITVNPDNTMALVMTKSDFTGSMNFSYEVTHGNGSTSVQNVAVRVEEGPQENGWGTGESHYMLATDENDKVIVDPGENHIKVYVTGSSDALSRADIARIEGLSVSDIDGDWLAASQYGQSENLALDEEAGTLLWKEVTPAYSKTSNWLLLERGYEYGEVLKTSSSGPQQFMERGAYGESELNPVLLGAWGEGDRPEITGDFLQAKNPVGNMVIQDIHFTGGGGILWVENLLFDNIKIEGESISMQQSDSITIRNSEVYDSALDSPNGGGNWGPGDRAQGLYMGDVKGVLLEGNFFDHNGWAEGYDPNGSGSDPMPPNMYNHNMYLQSDLEDVTFRDMITMRASSFGAGIRSGAFIEDSVFIDNNAGLSFDGGDYNGEGSNGNYSLVNGNVITSAAHKDANNIGAKSWGLNNNGELTTLVDNIIAHLADPNNPDEQEWKWDSGEALQIRKETYYNDTIVYNWQGSDGKDSQDENVGDLNTDVLDQTTIQLFTAALLGDDDATIADLANYLREQADGEFDEVVDADLIIRFFQTGFGIAPDLRETETTLRFVPDDLGEGVRWDNRLNWDTEDLPGTQDGDSVDLAGNHVVFGSNATIDTMDLGDDGYLNIYGGRLTVEGGITGDGSSEINLEGAGQLWTDGANVEDLAIDLNGGRFLNTGDVVGTDLTVEGGEAILAKDGGTFGVSGSKTLSILDADARVGFDDDDGDIALLVLDDDATVAFEADNGDLGTIGEFNSGAFGSSTDVNSGIDLGNATLSIDLAGLSASNGAAFTLMSADEIAGIFDEAVVDGLGGRDARIVVDYENDTVKLELTSGNGSVSVDTIGQESDVSSGQGALWAALTDGQGVFDESTAAALDEDDPLDSAA